MANSGVSESSALREWLDGIAWVRALDDDARQRLYAGSLERQVEPGGFICRKGEAVTHWHGVVEGLVKMSSDWITGKSASFTGIAAGGWFGEGSILKPEPRRYDVVALRKTRIACVRRETFLWLLDHSIAFNRHIISQINERLGLFIGLLESERLLDVDTRVARSLAALFHPILYPGTTEHLDISQEELGCLAGISRSRANRALKALEDAGMIRLDYGGLTVLDLDRLRMWGE